MKRLKQLSTTKIICLLVLVIFLNGLIIFTFIISPLYERYIDKCYGEYKTIRFNAESNPYDDGMDYFYYSDGMICRYSFETGETITYYIEALEGAYIDGNFVPIDDWVYYILSGTVRRLNCRTGEDEEIFSVEDIIRMCSKKEPSGYNGITLKKYKETLILILEVDVDDYEYIYICDVDGNMKTDCVDVNTLFSAENQTGKEEEIVYQGICIRRYYDADMEYYKMVDVREEESGQTIFSNRKSIKADGKVVSLWHEGSDGGFFYYVEGDSKEHEIGCLMEPVYAYSGIQSTKLTVEDGEIIGLLHVVRDMYCHPYYPSQEDLKYDILFRLNPQTGESNILYQTKDRYTRIIGYQDGNIYLMKNQKVYSQRMGSKRKRQLFKLPNSHYYVFDWQGDYLTVLCGEWSAEYGYESLETYKVK